MTVRFPLIYNSNFTACVDRASIYLKNVLLKKKDDVVLKMFLQKRGKTELEINDFVE